MTHLVLAEAIKRNKKVGVLIIDLEAQYSETIKHIEDMCLKYKDNIDLNLFNKFLLVLEKIEEGKCDQHQASFEVGKILKEIYIDSAMREGNKLDKKNKKKPEKTRKAKSISWNEFKKMNSE